MEPVIPPVSIDLLKEELTADKFVKKTKNGNNQIYIFNQHNSPNLMQEIGRLRELTFRDAGGGTGKPLDIDEFDTMEVPFEQLIVWNPQEQDIVGGYRFIHMKNVTFDEHREPLTPTAELFRFHDLFIDRYMEKTIELGRSFVQPAYQPLNNLRKGMFALDNIWDGLGAIITQNPDVDYFFGKITMYTDYDKYARDLILYFLNLYFHDPDKLVYPKEPVPLEFSSEELSRHFTGNTYDENYKILLQQVRARHESIPPLVNAYMNLSPTMRFFGTSMNPGFGNVEESGIMITIDDIYEFKKARHLSVQ